MINRICLDEKYSTTRLLTKEHIIENSLDDKLESVLLLPVGEERKTEGGLRTKEYFKKSFPDNPLISIVTVVFNGKKFLEETIQSVINQTYDNVEYIIIDGASTDGTIDIIKKYEDKIDYWVSEKDEGIYDAMNKGLQLCLGDFIAILNADDYYEYDAIANSVKSIIETNSDYCIGNVKFIETRSVIKPIFPLKPNKIYQEMPYPHVSAFISKKVYQEVGLFDTNFKIAGDHDMAVRIHLRGYKSSYVDKILANLHKGGISSGYESNFEFLKVAVKNGKHLPLALMTYLKQVAKLYLAKNMPPSLVKKIQKFKGSRFSD